MHKWLKISGWLVLIGYLFVVSGFVASNHNQVICHQVAIAITDSASRRFIDKNDIQFLIGKTEIPTLGARLTEINTDELEKVILKNQLIDKCQVYKTTDGILHIDITQREPIIRVIDNKQQSFFIDARGRVIPPSSKFSPHLIIATGNIRLPFNPSDGVSIFSPEWYFKTEQLRSLFHLAEYLNNDKLWKAQFEQIYITKRNEVELVPRIGPHLIQLGSFENFEEKLWKLKVIYREGFSRVGWNQYLYINLKYKDQVVCKKNE